MESHEAPYKIIGAMLLGVALGVGIGILLAPDKGSETRKRMLAKAGGLGDTLKEKFNCFVSEAKAEFDQANQFMENGVPDTAKSKVS